MALEIKEKEVIAASEEREVLNERVNTNSIGGNKIIITGVALVAGLILLYVTAKQNNYFGLMGAKAKVEKIAEKKQASPKAPEIIIPPIVKQEEVKPILISEKDIVTCAGGLRLPVGMPCPEASKTDVKPNGSNGSTGSNTKDPKQVAADEIQQRKFGGDLHVASITPVQSIDEFNKTNGLNNSNIIDNKTASLGNGLTDAIPVTYTPKITAKVNLNPSLTLSKGQMPDCNLVTAIRSSQPGFILCKLSMPVYSMDGKVVLMESGTQIEGEYRASIKAGQSSLQAIFTRFVTPNGVVGNFDSPGTDPLGRSGLDGEVDKHWIDRFGGAILSAVVEDAIEVYKANSQKGGDGSTNVFSNTPNTNSSGKAITDELLKSGSQIQPELLKNQGEIIKIFVARDVDFSTVYELKTAKKVQ